jgi:DNA-binding MarR family transcriptional regulator
MDTAEALLRSILATVARATFPPDEITRIVAPTKASQKQLLAYNLCDGETPQAEIGKRVKLDQGNLSRAIARWVEAGVVVRLGPDQLPLHVYPLINTKSGATQKRK